MEIDFKDGDKFYCENLESEIYTIEFYKDRPDRPNEVLVTWEFKGGGRAVYEKETIAGHLNLKKDWFLIKETKSEEEQFCTHKQNVSEFGKWLSGVDKYANAPRDPNSPFEWL